jgi:hypothetical protein
MGAGDGTRIPALQYLLTGLETGILAALAMLAWLGVSAMWYRRSFWTAANLLAAIFYGESALHNRFTVHTFAGLGLYLVLYGSLGMLFGLAIRDRHASLRITCLGILVTIGCYYLLFGWIWKRFDPLMVLYTHDRPMFAGHVLYGAMLGRYPRNLPRTQRAEEELRDLTVAPLAKPGPASGDVDVKD